MIELLKATILTIAIVVMFVCTTLLIYGLVANAKSSLQRKLQDYKKSEGLKSLEAKKKAHTTELQIKKFESGVLTGSWKIEEEAEYKAKRKGSIYEIISC